MTSISTIKFDVEKISNEIETLIRETTKKLNRDGVVIGLSGGLDSAVAATLAVRSLGSKKVHLLNMPDRDSKNLHQKHAKKLAKKLGVKIKKKSLTGVLRKAGTYKLLPLRFFPTKWLKSKIIVYKDSKLSQAEREEVLLARFKSPANSVVAKGKTYSFTKHRMRMVLLYQYAEVRNLLVIGAANKTEWLTGSFSQWGIDHCADLMPLLHLYRSELELLAEYLEVPDYIRNKAADADVLPGVAKKDDLLGTFKQTDKILRTLSDGNKNGELDQEIDSAIQRRIVTLQKYSKFMRETPYSINGEEM